MQMGADCSLALTFTLKTLPLWKQQMNKCFPAQWVTIDSEVLYSFSVRGKKKHPSQSFSHLKHPGDKTVFTWTSTTSCCSFCLDWPWDTRWIIYMLEERPAFFLQRLRCGEGVHCRYCVVHGETCTLYISLFWLLLIRINSAVKWQDLIYSNKRSMQQKGDGNHIILVSKTSYFKDSYCEETFAFLRQY